MKIANPGKTASHHALILPRASLRTLPQVTIVGGTPNPRKERAASVRIAPAIPNADVTRTGAREFGRTCRKMTRRFDNPRAVAAATYSIFLTRRNSPRVNRAIAGQLVKPIRIITSQIEPA